MKDTLVIDTLAYAIRATGGVARVWEVLMQGFLDSDLPVRLACGRDAREALAGDLPAALRSVESMYRLPATARRFTPYSGGGVFFPTAPRPSARGQRNILLVHDCIKELYYPPIKAMLSRFRRKSLYRDATKLIAISESTRLDLMRVHGAEIGDKVTVIYNPVDFAAIRRSAQSTKDSKALDSVRTRVAGRPYAMFIGYRLGGKNFREAVHLLSALPEHALVAVGPAPTPAELDMMAPFGSRMIFAGSLSDDDMFRLLRGANFLFWPCLSEGFGLPIVESLALGTPVIGLATQVNLDVSLGQIAVFESGSAASIRAAHAAIHPFPANHPMITRMETRYSPTSVVARYLEVVRSLL